MGFYVIIQLAQTLHILLRGKCFNVQQYFHVFGNDQLLVTKPFLENVDNLQIIS